MLLDTSDGFRPGRSGQAALRRVHPEVMRAPGDWLGARDLARFFDTMPPRKRLAVLAARLADRACLGLSARRRKAGGQPPGGGVDDEWGSPQGSIVSPVSAQVFLEHGLDPWGATVGRQHCRGEGILLRYAAAALALCERADDTQRFCRVLPGRRGQCGLRLNAQQTRLLACGTRHAWQACRARHPLPSVDVLGWPPDWGQRRTRKARLKRHTAQKRLRRAVVERNRWLCPERPARNPPDLWDALGRTRRGHCNDCGVTDNSHARRRFERAAHRLLGKWLHRRSQRRSFAWARCCPYRKRPPRPPPGRLLRRKPVWDKAAGRGVCGNAAGRLR